MEDQGGLVNLILKISFGSTIGCVWLKLFSPDFFFVFVRMRRIILPPPFYISEQRKGEVL